MCCSHVTTSPYYVRIPLVVTILTNLEQVGSVSQIVGMHVVHVMHVTVGYMLAIVASGKVEDA